MQVVMRNRLVRFDDGKDSLEKSERGCLRYIVKSIVAIVGLHISMSVSAYTITVSYPTAGGTAVAPIHEIRTEVVNGVEWTYMTGFIYIEQDSRPKEVLYADWISMNPNGASGLMAVPGYWGVYIGDGTNAAVSASISGHVNVPSELGGMRVIGISANAFWNCTGMTGVTVPDTVLKIQEAAFGRCSGLEEMTLPFIGEERGVDEWAGWTVLGWLFGRTWDIFAGAETTYYDNRWEEREFDGGRFFTMDLAEDRPRITKGSGFCLPAGLKKLTITDETVLARKALCDQPLTEVVLPETLRSMYSGTFENMPLKQVVIPSGIKTIEDSLFSGCTSLTNVVLHSGVTKIGGSAFRNCINLKHIDIPASVTSIGGNAFNHTGLSDIPAMTGMKCIADEMFVDCWEMTKATIPEGITSIGRSAFLRCPLAEVAIPNTVTNIGHYAFYGNSNLHGTLNIPGSVMTISEGAFHGCNGLSCVIIGEGVVEIGKEAFRGCDRWEGTLSIPNSVTNIGMMAFESCRSLDNIEIGAGVSHIAEKTFVGCDSVKTITLPDTITSIGYGPFGYCEGLLGLSISPSVTNTFYSFINCVSLKVLFLPREMENWSFSFKNSPDYLKVVYYDDEQPRLEDLPMATVTFFGNGDDYDETNITVFAGYAIGELPESPRRNDGYAFAGWFTEQEGGVKVTEATDAVDGMKAYAQWVSPLTIVDNVVVQVKSNGAEEVFIPDNITAIGDGAFDGCEGLKRVIIPDSIKYIGNSAFQSCHDLKEISIGRNVEEIGGAAFCGCDSLRKINIPDSVYKLGAGAFSHCESLEYVKVGSRISCIEAGTFAECHRLTSVELSNNIQKIEDSAFEGCSALSEIHLPKSLTRIGVDVFTGCNGDMFDTNSIPGVAIVDGWAIGCTAEIESLYSLDLSGICGVADEAFEGRALKMIGFGKDLRAIGRNAFSYNQLVAIVFPESLRTIGDGAFANGFNYCPLTVVAPDAFDFDVKQVFGEDVELKLHRYGDGEVPIVFVRENLNIGGWESDVSLIKSGDIIRNVPDGLVVHSEFDNCEFWLQDYVSCQGEVARNIKTVSAPEIYYARWLGYNADENGIAVKCIRSFFVDFSAISIPESIFGLPVTRLDYGAFFMCPDIKDISLPSTISSVSEGAFPPEFHGDTESCPGFKIVAGWVVGGDDSVENVQERLDFSGLRGLADGLMLQGPSVQEVLLPSSMTRINDCLMAGLGNLSKISIPASVKSVGADVFALNDSIADRETWPGFIAVDGWIVDKDWSYNDIEIDASVMDFSNAKGLADNVFGLVRGYHKVVLPEGVTIIPSAAFGWDNELCEVNIPSSVSKIGNGAFAYCNESLYDKVSYPGFIAVDGWIVGYDDSYDGDISTFDLSTARGIAEGVNIGCWAEAHSVRTVILPNSINHISEGLGLACGIENVIMSNGVRSIGEYSFAGGPLKRIVIPASVKSIGRMAFSCEGLEEVVFEGDALNILMDVENAFAGSPWLDSYLVQQGIFVKVSFDGCGGTVDPQCLVMRSGSCLGELPIPEREGCLFVGWSTILDEEVIFVTSRHVVSESMTLHANWVDASVFTIENGVLLSVNSGGMEEIVIPWNVTSIGESAFKNCRNIKRVLIQGVIDFIGAEAFKWCESLESIALPEGLRSIGYEAFHGCRALREINIPSSVTTLDSAFEYCTMLSSVAIPDGITEVHTYAFAYSGLEEVHLPDGLVRIWGGAFKECKQLKKVIIPLSVADVRAEAFKGCESLEVAWVPQALKDKLPEDVFADCNANLRIEYYKYEGQIDDANHVPTIADDENANVTGDAENGFVVKPSAGKKNVVVTIPDGVVADKVTVEVGTDVQTVSANGANVKVVKGGHDITEHLDIPSPIDGVVAVGSATVKESVLKETLDTAKGAVIDITPASPTLTTAETKPGLTYTLREGATLGGMVDGDSKVGDGEKWTPNITVKGGASGFYTIKVEK